jgi:hypothetical protein
VPGIFSGSIDEVAFAMRIMEQKRKPTKELKGLLRNPFRTGYLRLLQIVSCDFFDRGDPRKYFSRDVDYTKRIQLVAYQIYKQFFLRLHPGGSFL